MKKSKNPEPMFKRSEVAKILNCTTQTIANREAVEKYPDPQRDLNNYRVYSLDDVFRLQLITYSKIDSRPILSVLYDKGYKDTTELGKLIDAALSKKTA